MEEAQRHLEEHRTQGREVTEVTSSLRRMRERNHFADRIVEVFGGQDQ